MRALLTAFTALVLVVTIGGWSQAFETDFDDLHHFDRDLPAWKFGRGVVNVLSGPRELLTHITNNSIKGAYEGAYQGSLGGYLAGSTNGAIAGFFPGIYHAARRMTVGVLEILTFWKPEYGPTMDPEWGTRNMAWPEWDYFVPDPYWYNGPPR
jgi:putative exosortase-associated protein (TIGR04073 family)